jgi:hypothetical protein
MARPMGYQCSDEEREASQRGMLNRHQKRRDALGDDIAQAEPEEVQAGLVSAVREGRLPPRVVSQIIRLTLPPDDEEE